MESQSQVLDMSDVQMSKMYLEESIDVQMFGDLAVFSLDL